MWINSPLGKWEQEARVNKALHDAERMRALESATSADGTAKIDSLLSAARVRLRLLAARAKKAVEAIRTWLSAPAAPQDQSSWD